MFLCGTNLHTGGAATEMHTRPSSYANIFIKIFDPSAAKIYKRAIKRKQLVICYFRGGERGGEKLQKAIPKPTLMSSDNSLVSVSC